jgi:hypothetical protein
MNIPVILTDLCELADGASLETATVLLTFTGEAAARGQLLQLQAAVAAGTLRRPANTSLLLVPRAETIVADSFAAAKAAGYVIDEAALQAIWEQATAGGPS